MRGLMLLAFLSAVFSLANRAAGQHERAGLPSTQEMARWIRELWQIGANGRYDYRMPGTPAGQKGANYILEKFRAFGLQDLHREPVAAPLCLPDQRRLTIRAGGKQEAIPCQGHRIKISAKQ